MTRGWRQIGMLVAAPMVLASLIPLSQPFRHAAAWQVPAERGPYVDRALTDGAAAFGTTREQYRRITRPRVHQGQHQTCVTLATNFSDGDGSFRGCYDRQTGAFISSRAQGFSFRGGRLWDYVGPWLW